MIKVHPAADLFPMMTPDELKALGEDIKKNGLELRLCSGVRTGPPEMEQVGLHTQLKRGESICSMVATVSTRAIAGRDRL